MEAQSTLIEYLRDPQVKAYYIQLLESPLSAEEKYQKFLDFCARRGSACPLGLVAEPDPARDIAGLLPRIRTSLTRALRRVQRSQHRDGGWGLQIEKSNFWHTAYAVMFLKAARDMPDTSLSLETEPVLRRGLAYLEQHPEYWATDMLPRSEGMSVYDIALMFHCFRRAGRSFFRRESSLRLYHSVERLHQSQNLDGGWDASVWGDSVQTPVRVWSEVGATSMAIQALTETLDARFLRPVERGIRWLIDVQNPDGSWNDGSSQTHLPVFQIAGQPAVRKTCNAVQAILAGESLDLPIRPYQYHLDHAVDWLCHQARPVVDWEHRASNWERGFSAVDYDNIMLILETLLHVPEPPLSLLASCACWLVQGQRRQDEEDPEDGAWVLGHTARISLALVDFYRLALEKTTLQRIPVS